MTHSAEIDAPTEALERVRQYAALNYVGGGFDPEHMRAIANYCAAVLNEEPVPNDLDEAPEAYFIGLLRGNGWDVSPSVIPPEVTAEEATG